MTVKQSRRYNDECVDRILTDRLWCNEDARKLFEQETGFKHAQRTTKAYRRRFREWAKVVITEEDI